MCIPQTRVLVLNAEDEGPQGTSTTSPRRRYKHPSVQIETRELGPLAHDHIRVAMLYAGICGTDLHLLQTDADAGYIQTSAPVFIPPEGRVFGHEGVGRVLATGANVSSPSRGDVVAFASILACLQCDICRRGDFNQCSHARLLGMEIDGLFGTIVDVPASLAYDVSEINTDDGLRAMACLEPAAVALLACERGQVAAGNTVAIFGGGPIGIFCAILCKRVFGATHVALIEPLEFRRKLAARWCDAVYDVDSYFGIKSAVDVVIEASGDVDNISRVFPRIGANGRVILLGRRGKPLGLGDVDHMITQAISITGSRGHLGGSLGRVAALHRTGLLPLDAVITQELESLEALRDALQHPERLAEAQCKVVVRFQAVT